MLRIFARDHHVGLEIGSLQLKHVCNAAGTLRISCVAAGSVHLGSANILDELGGIDWEFLNESKLSSALACPQDVAAQSG